MYLWNFQITEEGKACGLDAQTVQCRKSLTTGGVQWKGEGTDPEYEGCKLPCKTFQIKMVKCPFQSLSGSDS